ncbi:hypothetical protein HGH92_26470 [Chitinophaga varians]|uniref:Uncharacterized protein n=1 Tax=Chitinophaga varians TaxID=2202339 RepID=A0A847S4W0_9BACT|nr:hypothetical protein [Chitinophaga varians]NLR67877.1 hypothetical protein [Chitinophaga varians]
MKRVSKIKEKNVSHSVSYRSFSALLFIILGNIWKCCRKKGVEDDRPIEKVIVDVQSPMLDNESVCTEVGATEFAKDYKCRKVAARVNRFTGCDVLIELAVLVRETKLNLREQGVCVTYAELYAAVFEIVKEKRKSGGLCKSFSFFLI